MKALPNKYWFKRMDLFHSEKYLYNVLSDISKHPKLEDKIKEFKNDFVKFACLERMHYEPDIYDESYLLRKRMYNINVKQWKKIQSFIFKRDNYTCAYCGCIGGVLEVDHIVPFSKGGSDDFNNLITSCRKCNRQKKDKSIDEFNKWKQNHEKLFST